MKVETRSKDVEWVFVRITMYNKINIFCLTFEEGFILNIYDKLTATL